ncbi:MAG TPA: hypothetical protein VGE98_05115, partial [Thermoanaerobaculia bacterium]
LEKRGEDGAKLRSIYQTQARLSDGQARLLHEVASDCTAQVAAQDARAEAMIRAARAKFARGSGKGALPPPPPAELAALQAERDAIIRRARERLQEGFGNDEALRFHAFVEEHVGRQLRSLAPSLRPAPANGPRVTP